MFSVKGDVKEVTRYLNSLERKVVPAATVSALNKTISGVRTESSREIKKETGLKSGYIKKRLKIVRARRGRYTAKINALPGAPNLIEFVRVGRQLMGRPGKRTKRSREGGVRAKAWNKSKVYKGSFIGSGKNSGKPLVYVRTGKGRYPIKALHGPSVPRTFMQRKVERVMEKEARRRFRKNFTHEIRWRISRL